VEPVAGGLMPLDGLHSMYWEECGNPRGIPVVFLHGGPGAGCAPTYRRFFDPAVYRIILYDQRGAGRSQPACELRANTTQDLVDDMERLRKHRRIDQWLLFGGSWGSTLALAYGQAHPERCLGFILRGIFLGRRSEVDWFLHSMGTFFPEAERGFLAPIPPEQRGAQLLDAYYRRLLDPDPSIHMPAARAWCRYESACSTLRPNPAVLSAPDSERSALALARIEAHYFVNNLFLEKDQLLRGLPAIAHLPATIVQGRYDMVCPIISADALARAWPGCDYRVVDDAGHSAMEPGIRAALSAATARFKLRFESLLA
jgi:proline iminopeptidase